MPARLLVAEDYRTLDAVVISEGLWERAFGGDPEAVGATVVLDGRPYTVAGVMAGVGEPGLLVQGGGSPHTYQMRPSEARMLDGADVVFHVGEGLETFRQNFYPEPEVPKKKPAEEMEGYGEYGEYGSGYGESGEGRRTRRSRRGSSE